MLDGHMRHEDHMGNVGELTEGGVQWMSAGRGVIHSEMPQQEEGRMRGFQLWINLPSAEKMTPAQYRDIPAGEIPEVSVPGGSVKVIAGAVVTGNGTVPGPINGLTTEPVFLDVALEEGATFEQPLPATHNIFVYPYEGELETGDDAAATPLAGQAAGVLGKGDHVRVRATGGPARFVLLAGKPLNEPVVQHGPFVMNTREEIDQALRDYRDGVLAHPVLS